MRSMLKMALTGNPLRVILSYRPSGRAKFECRVPAGASFIGKIKVGSDVAIGANLAVSKSIAGGAVVVAKSGRIVV